MSVRILSDSEVADFLVRHPEFNDVTTIPTYGVYVSELGHDYLVSYNAGKIRVQDITAIDPDTGNRIDPSIAQQGTLSLWWDSIFGGISDSFKVDFNPFYFGSVANILLIGFIVYLLIINRKIFSRA